MTKEQIHKVAGIPTTMPTPIIHTVQHGMSAAPALHLPLPSQIPRPIPLSSTPDLLQLPSALPPRDKSSPETSLLQFTWDCGPQSLNMCNCWSGGDKKLLKGGPPPLSRALVPPRAFAPKTHGFNHGLQRTHMMHASEGFLLQPPMTIQSSA